MHRIDKWQIPKIDKSSRFNNIKCWFVQCAWSHWSKFVTFGDRHQASTTTIQLECHPITFWHIMLLYSIVWNQKKQHKHTPTWAMHFAAALCIRQCSAFHHFSGLLASFCARCENDGVTSAQENVRCNSRMNGYEAAKYRKWGRMDKKAAWQGDRRQKKESSRKEGKEMPIVSHRTLISNSWLVFCQLNVLNFSADKSNRFSSPLFSYRRY